MAAEDLELEEELVWRRRRGRSDSAGSSGSASEGSWAGDDGWGLDGLFDQLVHECRFNQPGESLAAHTRERVERLPLCERARLVSRLRGGCAPLFVACAQGNLAIAEYLLQVCGADIEQRGLYRARAERTTHRVSPLWAAAVSGRLDVVRALAEAGAGVDARSDSGSTPLRSACFMSHVEVARYLLARGADARGANHYGGSCLVNAVQCPALCRLLIAAGADVNAQDAQLKTALHYAIQEHREDTTCLLLAAGADPALVSRAGDDALQTACIKGSRSLVHLLLRTARYPAARVADAYEVLGASQLDEYNDAEAALASWRAATDFRRGGPGGRAVPKRPWRGPCAALGGAREWTSPEQLAARADDVDWLRAQALLVVLRVLGPLHRDTLFRLMYRGAAYADAHRFSRCVALWTWVLDLRIQRDTLLHQETQQTLVAVTRLLVEQRLRAGALRVLRLVVRDLPGCQRLLAPRPAHRAHCAAWDRALRCVLHLALVALPEDEGEEEEEALRAEVRAVVRLDPRVSSSGDSMLHLACSRLNVVRSTYFADDAPSEALFPSVRVARLLLQCGADVRSGNVARSPPLLVAAVSDNFSTELVELLVSMGGHLDQPNRFGDSAADLLAAAGGSRVCPPAGGSRVCPPAGGSRVCPLRHVTLACRAARVLARGPVGGWGPVPPALRPFLELHRP